MWKVTFRPYMASVEIRTVRCRVPALLATLEAGQFRSTLEPEARFLRPVRPGRIRASGRVVDRRADIACLEAALTDTDGALMRVISRCRQRA